MFGKEKGILVLREKLNLTVSKAEETYDAFVAMIAEAAETDSVRIPGIGVITKNVNEAHTARNPQTQETVEVGERFNYRIKSATRELA